MKKQMKLQIAAENPNSIDWFYSDIELPAERYEIEDALQRARIGSEDTYREYTVYECDTLPMIDGQRLDSPSIEELNFFAERLASLNDEEKLALRAVAPKHLSADENAVISVKDLINLTYGLEYVMIASNVNDTNALGQFVVANTMNELFEDVSDEMLPYLNYYKIGQMQQKNDDGVFMDGHYIVAGGYEFKEVYDGRQALPTEESVTNYAFRLELMNAPDGDDGIGTDLPTRWLSLPTDAETAQAVVTELGAERIEDCVYIGFESTIPQIESDHFGDMQDFERLNNLSQMLVEMTPSDQVKFKAVLSSEEPSKIEEILDTARNLHQYKFASQVEDAPQFFKTYLLRHLDTRFDPKWLDTLMLRTEGNELLERIGGTVTDYGVISARGGSLYEPITRDPEPCEELEQTEEPEEQTLKMGGIQ